MSKTDWTQLGLAWCGLWHKLVPFSRIDAAAKKLRGAKAAAAETLQLSSSGNGRTRITALIDGSRPTADLPALPAWTVAAWFDALAKKPSRALSLLEGRFTFDEAVATSHEAGVGIFEPEAFQGACDCYCASSWRTGVCAHEAMLLAIAGREVERDIAFYFRLRGVDARAELEARGIRPAPPQPMPSAAYVIAALAASVLRANSDSPSSSAAEKAPAQAASAAGAEGEEAQKTGEAEAAPQSAPPLSPAEGLAILSTLPLDRLPRRPSPPSAKLPDRMPPFSERFRALMSEVESNAAALYFDEHAALRLEAQARSEALAEAAAPGGKRRGRPRKTAAAKGPAKTALAAAARAKAASSSPSHTGASAPADGAAALLASRRRPVLASPGWQRFLAALGVSPELAERAALEPAAAAGLADLRLEAEAVWSPTPRGTRFDIARALRPLGAADYFGALAQLSDADSAALPTIHTAWRQTLRTALALFAANDVAPMPCVPAGAEAPAPRILWTPSPNDATAPLLAEFAHGVRPLLPYMFSRSSAAAFRTLGFTPEAFAGSETGLPDARAEGPWTAAACWALSLAASGIAHWLLRRKPGTDLLEAALVGRDLSAADGLVGPEAQHALSKGFRSLLLGLRRAWRPAVIVKRGADRRITVHFALLAGGAAASADAAGSLDELEAPEPQDAAREPSPGEPLSPEEAAAAREAELAAGPVCLDRAAADPAWAPELPSVLAALFDAARLVPFLQPLADHPERPITLDAAALRTFLLEVAPAFAPLGIPLALPAKLRRFARPRLVARISAGKDKSASAAPSLLTAAALADFNWQVAVGDRTLSVDELRTLARENPLGGVVPVDDDFVLLDPESLRELRRTASRPPSAIDKVRAMLSGEYLGATVDVAPDLEARIEELLKVDDVPPPAGLCGTLRPYQARGYAWLVKNMRLGLGSLIADDMGLGKTIQVIAAILEMKAEGLLNGKTVLITAPTGVLTNWEREVRRFAPSLSIGVYHGEGRTVNYIGVPDVPPSFERYADASLAASAGGPEAAGTEAPLDRSPISESSLAERAAERFSAKRGFRRRPGAAKKPLPDVVITSYTMLRRELDELMRLPLGLLVLDEAQAVKNASTSQAEAARLLRAPRVIAMTGTPVENRLMEYWSIFSIVLPGLLGAASEFRAAFAKPIEGSRDAEALERFRRLTSPFMIRRVKTDKSVIADLPEKNTIDRYTSITKPQAALYAKVLKEHLGVIASLEDEAHAARRRERNLRAGVEFEAKRRGQVLALITKLKQICDSPSLYYGTVSAAPDAGKAEALLEILAECREAGRKALIFTQYVEMGARLQNWIERETGRRPDFLCGAINRTQRTEMVDRFQNSPDSTVLLVSLRAGGTGLNLTAASCVIHYDLWWNPAVEEQATDRAYRIGQRRDVLVYRFVTAGTFEERVNEMLEKKRELTNLTVQAGESWIGDLSSAELAKLFALSADPDAQSEAAESGGLADDDADAGAEDTDGTGGVVDAAAPAGEGETLGGPAAGAPADDAAASGREAP